MITIVCLVYKSTEYADFTIKNIYKHTPMLHTGEAEFIFIANNATDEVKKHLVDNNYNHVVRDYECPSDDCLRHWGFAAPSYIHEVYSAYNLGIKMSKDIACLVATDMAYSQDWLENLLKKLNSKRVVTSKLVETTESGGEVFRNRRTGNGAYLGKFGKSLSTFKEEEFLKFAERVKIDDIQTGGGHQPLLMYKWQAELVGMYPDGNLRGHNQKFQQVSQYGDDNLMTKLLDNGIHFVTALDSIVYHWACGEQRDLV
jgi:hypothetical protein